MYRPLGRAPDAASYHRLYLYKRPCRTNMLRPQAAGRATSADWHCLYSFSHSRLRFSSCCRMETARTLFRPLWRSSAMLPQGAARRMEAVTGRQTLVQLFGLALLMLIVFVLRTRGRASKTNRPPVVPGVPFLGNLLQLSSKRPHLTFTKWSQEYGPIYTIRTGQVNQVIVSSPEIAKEALVTKYASIANRDLPSSIMVLSRNKKIVAMHDYGEKYQLMKKLLMNSLLGRNPQRCLRPVREAYLNKAIDDLYAVTSQSSVVNVRNVLSGFLFRIGMHQVFGREITHVNVPELDGSVGFWEMFDILVEGPMRGAVDIDWRDFFPSLSWIPNKSLEDRVRHIEHRRSLVIKALVEEQRRLLDLKGRADCHCDFLLENSSQLTEEELCMMVWEPIIESSDTTLVTSEWAMYELALQLDKQEKLHDEIVHVVGEGRMVCEDDLPKLPYLAAVVKETLRKYSPVPILPPRLVQQEVELGGYTVPAGYQVIVNTFGVHHDKTRWTEPDIWDPARVLEDDKLDLGISDMRVMPFGGGKRICAGMTQVFFTVPMVIASLLQHFEWSLPTGTDSAAHSAKLTMQKLVPLEAIPRPRLPSRLPLVAAKFTECNW